MTELPTYSRLARYIWAVIVDIVVALIVGTVTAYAAYHLAWWIITESAEPGMLGLIRDLPGPFTGWRSHALWYCILMFVIGLPKELIKAHRNVHYPVTERRAAKLKRGV